MKYSWACDLVGCYPRHACSSCMSRFSRQTYRGYHWGGRFVGRVSPRLAQCRVVDSDDNSHYYKTRMLSRLGNPCCFGSNRDRHTGTKGRVLLFRIWQPELNNDLWSRLVCYQPWPNARFLLSSFSHFNYIFHLNYTFVLEFNPSKNSTNIIYIYIGSVFPILACSYSHHQYAIMRMSTYLFITLSLFIY